MIFVMIFVMIIFMLIVVFFAMAPMGARGNTVVVFQVIHRQTEEPAFKVIAAAQGQTLGAAGGILNLAIATLFVFFMFFVLALFLVVVMVVVILFTYRLARDFKVIPVAIKRAGMKGEVTRSGFPASNHVIQAGGRIVTILKVAAGFLGQCRGDTVVNNIDYTADSTTAIEQGGRPPQHFNTVCQHGLYRHGVVGTDIRCIGTAGAILQDGYAGTLLSANDRLAYTWAERGIGQARAIG
jgi:hypothetical protein